VVDEYRSDITPYVVTARDTPGSPAYGCRVRLNDASVFTGWRQIRVGAPADEGAVPILITGPSDNRMDLVFIADEDTYGKPDDPAFLKAVGDLVRDAIYRFSFYNQFQNGINIWLAQQPGKADRESDDTPCVLTKPVDWDENYAFAEAGVILHSDAFRDCAKAGLFTTQTTTRFPFRILRHESGHKFGLSDEYCCNTSYFESSLYPNVYETLEACEADAPNLGREPQDCRSWTRDADQVEWYSSEPAVNDLMNDSLIPNAADIRRIQYYFEDLMDTQAQGSQP